MKTITVAQLRQNPTAALEDVQAGADYVVTRHRRMIARLVPLGGDAVEITPAPRQSASHLAARSRDGLRGYKATEALLAELAQDR
jgi:antitoxin (DNA-binding transcriptional repressor) of toxin-antitoxin stability system